MPFTRRGKWYPDPTTRPSRRHTSIIVSALRQRREQAEQADREFYEALLEAEEPTDAQD